MPSSAQPAAGDRAQSPRHGQSDRPIPSHFPSGRGVASTVPIRPPSVYSLGFLEAVADAVKRLDHIERVIDLLEFLAQTLDVTVDRAVIDINLIVVGRIHQRIAGLDDARPCGKRLQDQELGHRQGYRLAVPMAGMALRIKAE